MRQKQQKWQLLDVLVDNSVNMKIWFISWIIGQDVQKLQILQFFAVFCLIHR